ncbi:hypothetical protein BOO23_16670 [Vibrio navarrensis]|nr:hypothetical protein [Vibrio navarrensis]
MRFKTGSIVLILLQNSRDRLIEFILHVFRQAAKLVREITAFYSLTGKKSNSFALLPNSFMTLPNNEKSIIKFKRVSEW